MMLKVSTSALSEMLVKIPNVESFDSDSKHILALEKLINFDLPEFKSGHQLLAEGRGLAYMPVMLTSKSSLPCSSPKPWTKRVDTHAFVRPIRMATLQFFGALLSILATMLTSKRAQPHLWSPGCSSLCQSQPEEAYLQQVCSTPT